MFGDLWTGGIASFKNKLCNLYNYLNTSFKSTKKQIEYYKYKHNGYKIFTKLLYFKFMAYVIKQIEYVKLLLYSFAFIMILFGGFYTMIIGVMLFCFVIYFTLFELDRKHKLLQSQKQKSNHHFKNKISNEPKDLSIMNKGYKNPSFYIDSWYKMNPKKDDSMWLSKNTENSGVWNDNVFLERKEIVV